MFLRSHNSKSNAKAKEKRAKDDKAPANALRELGLLTPEPPRSAWSGDVDRPTYTSGGRSIASNTGYTYPEKNSSVSAGNIPAPSQRSSASVHSREGQTRNNPLQMNGERNRFRRERTFVGSECSVCEEPLEHTLQGERILQFSCSHVSHEACFYEFIRDFEPQYCPTCNAPLHLDTTRGGNVLDIEKISNMVRSVSVTDHRSTVTPTPASAWEDQSTRPPSRNSNHRQAIQSNVASTSAAGHSNTRDSSTTRISYRDARDVRDARDSVATADRYHGPLHGRSDSEATGVASSGGYPETTQSGGPRRAHDYDVQAMETTLTSPRTVSRNPIPAPTVTVRSEFPTINRSRQQQTLTCLITIEVPSNKWRPDPEDLQLNSMGTPQLMSAGSQHGLNAEDQFTRNTSPVRSAVARFYPYEAPEVLEEMMENLRTRVDNWHGLEFNRFGKLRLYGTLRVGKDKMSWQELECYLFAEMLICVKEKKNAAGAAAATPTSQLQQSQQADGVVEALRKTTRCALKGSILIKKHLNEVAETGSIDENILTLSLSVAELPQFHLRFDNRNQLKLWQQALLDLNAVETPPVRSPDYDRGEFSETEEEDWQQQLQLQQQQRTPGSARTQRLSSVASSWGGGKSVATTAATEYTNYAKSPLMASPAASVHVPMDVVVVVPISSSMQGVKINLVRDALRFMVHTLGERDRMGLVTFGSGGGGVPVVGMTTKSWPGWSGVLASIKPVGQKSHRADVVEGANVAMDLLMQRKYNNPIATIMLISDASTSDADSVDFVVSRAEAAKITIHSFGLGMTHKPDTMIELSTRTKASYTYVKDWMMLRECLAGCLGAMQTLSHQNVKLKLKLPEGSPAKFYKISGALQITKRATGRDAEAQLGDLRFGDKRDILVQLLIPPDNSSQEQLPQDPWETIVSGLEALSGPVDQDEPRTLSVEEVPLIQADLTWGDILRDGTVVHLPRPSLLAITMLPAANQHKSRSWQNSPPIPPHPSIVQRRMELLTSDMLTRALTLVSRGQHERAHTLLNETRSILKGLGKGGLPPVPPLPSNGSSKNGMIASPSVPSTPHPGMDGSPTMPLGTPDRKHTPSPTASAISAMAAGFPPPHSSMLPRSRSNDGLSTGGGSMMNGGVGTAAGIDAKTVAALDAELEASLEWINHPAVFGRDSRKAVLQAIGVISSQRAFTFRTPVESLWATRVGGVKRLTEKSREWREEGGGEGGIMEEA